MPPIHAVSGPEPGHPFWNETLRTINRVLWSRPRAILAAAPGS